MKILIIISAIALASCGSQSGQAKFYEDSAKYYSAKLAALTDSGFSSNDSTRIQQEGRLFIYKTMRQHYIDKMKEAK